MSRRGRTRVLTTPIVLPFTAGSATAAAVGRALVSRAGVSTGSSSASGVASGSGSSAATLWVNGATGNDSNTIAQVRAGGGSVAWATIGRAAWGSMNRAAPVPGEAAAAGDIVAIAAGTYTYTGSALNDRFAVAFQAVNEGTLGNPITFQAIGQVRLASPGGNSPVAGSVGSDYITWYADITQGHTFLITCDGRGGGTHDTKGDATVVNTAPDTGPVALNGTIGVRIEGFDINGSPQLDYEDNWDGIRVEDSDSFILRNNTIYSFNNSSNSVNGCGVKIYYSANGIVEHNHISDAGSGVVFKDAPGGSRVLENNHIRLNWIEDVGHGIAYSMSNEGGSLVYQNIIVGASIGWFVTGVNIVDEWVYNNIFYNCGNGTYYKANHTSGATTGVRLWNNIFWTTTRTVEFENQAQPAQTAIDFEHNVYHLPSGGFYAGSDGTRTFASYNTAYADQNTDAPDSVNADPLFVTAGSDFHLQGGSPAQDLGRTLDGGATVDAGAYITGSEVIGPEA